MDIPVVNGNGKNWLAKGLVQALIIIGLVAYIAVDKISTNVSGGADKDQNVIIDINSQRLARLEEIVVTLRPVPSEVAGMKVALEGLKTTIEKIEKRLDAYIAK